MVLLFAIAFKSASISLLSSAKAFKSISLSKLYELSFKLILDTGGIDFKSKSIFHQELFSIEFTISFVFIVFVEYLASNLSKIGKKLLSMLNKVDLKVS
jgi:hypothetical protein